MFDGDFPAELWMRNETSTTGDGDEKLCVDVITLGFRINDSKWFFLPWVAVKSRSDKIAGKIVTKWLDRKD